MVWDVIGLYFFFQDSFSGPVSASLEYLDLGHNAISRVDGELAMANVKYLNLERNGLADIDGAFNLLRTLQVLELGGNKIDRLSDVTFMGMDSLISLDLSDNRISEVRAGVFKNQYLNEVNVSGNLLEELPADTFSDLSILEVLDLSRNRISAVSDGAFDSIPRLKRLLLRGNRLSSYRGDFFSGSGGGNDTDLHTLDLSDNELTYLYPESFARHPRLARLNFARNKFSFFPTQFVRGLRSLSELDLSGNLIKNVDDGDYANLPVLRRLDLSGNEIETLSNTAFQVITFIIWQPTCFTKST